MAPAIVRDHAVAFLTEEQHLSIPVVRRQRPAVAENYRLSLTPVLVINLRAVFGSNCRHKIFSSVGFAKLGECRRLWCLASQEMQVKLQGVMRCCSVNFRVSSTGAKK